jgi:hypothetical protein
MVVDESLNRVEEAEAQQHRTGEELCGPMAPLRGSSKDEQAGHYEQVGRAMENSVPKRIELEVLDRVDGVQLLSM